MVNLEWYRTFKEIYKTGTLTGAAQALFISQPGVSLHLGALEHYTGYKLFERTGRKMVPTERGKVLFNVLSGPLSELESAENQFQRCAEVQTPTLSIGMCFETFQVTLEPYIADLPFNLIIRFGDYQEMVGQLEKGILDLIVTPQKGKLNTVDYEKFSKETLVLVAGQKTVKAGFQTALKKKDRAVLQVWLKSQKWFGTTNDMEHLFRFWQQNFDKQPDFRPNFIVPNMHSIIRCLSSGSGLAVIPEFLCAQEVKEGLLQKLWTGYTPAQNGLYFGVRKNTPYPEQIVLLKSLFKKAMPA